MNWQTTLKILGLMLIYLKCTNYIDISWFIVILPFIGDMLFKIVIVGISGIIAKLVMNKLKR